MARKDKKALTAEKKTKKWPFITTAFILTAAVMFVLSRKDEEEKYDPCDWGNW